MEFKEYLRKTARKLEEEVNRILKGELKEAEKIDKKLAPLLKAFIKSCQGGKRIRGALVKLGYDIVSSELEDKELLKVAASYEIVHAAILAHDDIIDQSLKRRGKPSLYQALGGNHYGISQAISLADYGFFLAFKIILKSHFSEESKIKVLKVFSQVMMNTTWGELLDLEDSAPDVVMRLKTACYTIAGPMQIGAILAGAEEKLLERLGRFGENLGIAFQIRDDILDAETPGPEKIARSREKAEKLKEQALKMLPQITAESKMSKILEQLGEYLVQRTK